MLNESLLAEDKIYVNSNAVPGFNRYTSLTNKPIVEFLAGVYQISFDTMKGIIKFPIND